MKKQRKPIVQESPQAPMVLVPHRSRHKTKRKLEVILVITVVAVLFSGWGYWLGITQLAWDLSENNELSQQLMVLETKNITLRDVSAVNRQGVVLEKKATERVRQENVQLQDKVAELQKAVSFYKGIMAPLKNDKGLRVEELYLSHAAGVDRYRYEIVLTQVANNRSYVSGKVYMQVLGTLNDKPQTLSLVELSLPGNKNGIKFKFRYFQNLSGELILPKGFLPEQVTIMVQSKGKKAMRLKRLFDWKTEKVKFDVG